MNTPITQVELPADVRQELLRCGVMTWQGLLELSDDEVVRLSARRAWDESTLSQIRRLRRQWNEQSGEGSVRAELASQHGVTQTPLVWSWAELLRLGYDWQTVQSLDNGLISASLPPLMHLPRSMVVGPETVRYLTQIGCPLHKLPIQRVSIDEGYRDALTQMGLRSVLDFCLSDHDELSANIREFDMIEASLLYYLEWLATQSSWSSEIDQSRPSPLALLYVTNTTLLDLTARMFNYQARGHRDVSRDREIVRMRYGLGYDRESTLQEVADKFAVSRQRVQQICDKATTYVQQSLQRDEVLRAFVWVCINVIEESHVIASRSLVEEVADHFGLDDNRSLSR